MDDAKLIELLHERFIAHAWHEESLWPDVAAKLANMNLGAIKWMEESGGEPAVAPWWTGDGTPIICDCSPESPPGRRSLCYDRAAWEKRKKARPDGDALSLAEEHGARLMTEREYHLLQEGGSFDNKTSSWLFTEDEVRKNGGAIFGDHRFGRTFIYHNGAESYYSARGFRAVVD